MNPLRDYSQGKKVFWLYGFTFIVFFICTLPAYLLLLELQNQIGSGFLYSVASFVMFALLVLTVLYAKGTAERGENENLGMLEALRETHRWYMLVLRSLPVIGRILEKKSPDGSKDSAFVEKQAKLSDKDN